MNDQFPKVEGLGILGECTGRSRALKVGELAQCQTLGLHDKQERSPEAEAYLLELRRQIEEASPQIAILVGYSYLHHELAKFFKSVETPVVLIELTPQTATQGIDPKEISALIAVALGISVQGSPLIREAGIPYACIGSPHKDRVSRVTLKPESLGLDSHRPVVSIFPGGRGQDLEKVFPCFWDLAQRLAADPAFQVVLALTSQRDSETTLLIDGKPVTDMAPDAPELKGVRILRGIHLELLSLSQLAITGGGAVTVECALFGVPFMPLCADSAKSEQSFSMLNQIMGKVIVPEYQVGADREALYQTALSLIRPGVARDKMLGDMQGVARSLQGYAAENAVEYIGREIAQWKQSTKKPKGTQTA